MTKWRVKWRRKTDSPLCQHSMKNESRLKIANDKVLIPRWNGWLLNRDRSLILTGRAAWLLKWLRLMRLYSGRSSRLIWLISTSPLPRPQSIPAGTAEDTRVSPRFAEVVRAYSRSSLLPSALTVVHLVPRVGTSTGLWASSGSLMQVRVPKFIF